MVFESFKNLKQKIQKTWERSEENENNLKDIPLVTLDFNSINFNKKINTLSILTDEIAPTTLNNVESILLENFPEWAINMIEPTIIYSTTDGFIGNLIPISFSEAFENGTLKTGDVTFSIQKFHYWFNRIDNKHFLLKLFYSGGFSEATVSEIGFFSSPVTTFINISLKILNHRIYEVMNEKKE